MADANASKRILDMLAAGHISVDAATDLLKSVTQAGGFKRNDALDPATGGQPSAAVRMLRISIASTDGSGAPGTKVRVNVPVALAKFASRFVPQEASAELSAHGIELDALLRELGESSPGGRIVDLELNEAHGEGTTAVLVEVV